MESAKWLALTAAILGWMFDGLEMGLFPLVGRPAMLEFTGSDEASGFWFSIIIAVFLVGAACGGVLLGWLGDRIGRTRAMVWSVLAYSIFSGLCAFTTAPWQIAVLRFLAALGMGGQWALGVALVMEIWPSKSRPMMAGIIGASANVGFLLIALLSLGLASFISGITGVLHSVLPAGLADTLVANKAWRLLMLLGALPALLTFFIRVFVPESEMWEKSSKTGAAKPSVGNLFQGGLAKLTLLGAGLGAVALLGTWGSVQWIPAWADKLSNKAHGAREAAQICSALGAIVFSILVALIAEKTNRRKTYFVLGLLSLVTCQLLFRTHTSYDGGLLAWTFLVGGLTAGFYGWLPLYLPELFPTRLRASGAGFTFNAGRLLAAIGTLVSGGLVKHFHGDFGRMCSVISLVYLVGIILIWFAPETKGKPLPE
jgi:MFS family permease